MHTPGLLMDVTVMKGGKLCRRWASRVWWQLKVGCLQT